jgi:hypothetical protein
LYALIAAIKRSPIVVRLSERLLLARDWASVRRSSDVDALCPCLDRKPRPRTANQTQARPVSLMSGTPDADSQAPSLKHDRRRSEDADPTRRASHRLAMLGALQQEDSPSAQYHRGHCESSSRQYLSQTQCCEADNPYGAYDRLQRATAMSDDRVFAMGGAYWCIVDGRTYGAWDCREYALAGMQVEQRRAAERKAAQLHNRTALNDALWTVTRESG